MPRRHGIALLAGVAALALAGVAAASPKPDSIRIRKGLTAAQKAHWLKPTDTARYRSTVGLALRDTTALPKGRVAVISSLLNEIARQSGSYTSPRALALFSMLDTNVRYLETHAMPTSRIDITGDDGVVYRWFGVQGFQFHPLANFGALNAAIAANDADAVRTLAAALVARAVPRGPGLRWEYYFPFGGGRPPWTSGMAQAVAAQALSRAGALAANTAFTAAAAKAYAAVPVALVQHLAEGPWIKLYSFDRLVVLNAQLQAILSLEDYAAATNDPNALTLATSMTVAAQALLPKFDTGYWSLYALGGAEAPLEYQKLVTQQLQKLAARTQDPVWQSAAARFFSYVREAPQLDPAPIDAPVQLYPQPADGYLDAASVSFNLSKRSRVTLSAAGRTVTATLNRGLQTLTWKPGDLQPGTYSAQLVAVDLAGNRTTVSLPQPFVVAWDTQPPGLTGSYADGVVSWQGVDPGTPKLRLRVDLTGGDGTTQTLDLGFHSVSGTANVTLPPGTWQATLTATNTAANSTSVDLGTIVVSG
jgi:D-glucuronyl C5-epimerase C-terminus